MLCSYQFDPVLHFPERLAFPVCVQYFLFASVPFLYTTTVIGDAAIRRPYKKRPTKFNPTFYAQIIGAALTAVFASALLIISVLDSLADKYAGTERMYGNAIFLLACLEMFGLLVYQTKLGHSSTGRVWCFWLICVFSFMPSVAVTVKQILDPYPDLIWPNASLDLYCGVFLTFYLILVLTWVLFSCPSVDGTFAREQPHPEAYSSFVSQLLLSWSFPLLLTGYRRTLEMEDLWAARQADTCLNSALPLAYSWNRELKRKGFHDVCVRGLPGQTCETDTSEKTQAQVEFVPSPGPEGEGKRPSPSLVRAMLPPFLPTFLVCAIYKLVNDSLTFTAPLLLERLLTFMALDDAPAWYGMFIAGLLFLNSVVQTAFLQRYFYIGMTLGMRIRSALIDMIYRKSLVLSSKGRQQSTIGQIVNLMSVDSQIFMDMMTYLNMVWSGPFQIVMAITLLYRQLGPSVFAGLGYMILVMPANIFIGHAMKKFQMKQMKEKDNRIKLLTDVLNGIKVLKLYGWEPAFIKKLTKIRDREIRLLRNAGNLTALTSFFWICSPYMVALCAFGAYVLSGHTLTPTTAFVSLSLFNILRFPMSVLPMMITVMIQANVSLERIRKFLLLDQLQTDAVVRQQDREFAISIDNCTFTWESIPDEDEKKNQGKLAAIKQRLRIGGDGHKKEDAEKKDEKKSEEEEKMLKDNDKLKTKLPKGGDFTLRDITMRVPHGSLTAIVGSVGSGKSSLLNAMLGEMHKQSSSGGGGGGGCVNVSGSVAYVGQQVWIRNATLRDNILFGAEYDEEKYNRVVEACALLDDLNILDNGDMTEIGEKGINLSGGQKSRISLARAVYTEQTCVYLLDDPLAAVDAHVASHIFDRVIGNDGGILAGKTRVLVTNKLHLLRHVDQIVTLKDGRIEEMGTFEQLVAARGCFAHLKNTYLQEKEQQEETPEPHAHTLQQTIDHVLDEKKSKESTEETGAGEKATEKDELLKKEKKSSANSKIIQAETMETGKVGLPVYWEYCKAIGVHISIIIFIGLVLVQVMSYLGILWLAMWSDESKEILGRRVNELNYTQEDRTQDLEDCSFKGLLVYGIIGLVFSTIVVVNAFMVVLGVMRSSRGLHSRILEGVMRSPVSFFDATPMGRITNRFSKDIDVVDTSLPNTMKTFLQCVLIVLTTMAAIIKTIPVFAVALLPLVVGYVFILIFFVSTSRQLRRIESNKKSPLYSNFGETLQGMVDIRAYQKSDYFIHKNQQLVDVLVQTAYTNIVMNRWLAIRLEAIGTCVVFCSAAFLVLYRDTISAGNAGVAITYAVSSTQVLNWLVRMSSDLESIIVAVERIKEYALLPPEADWESAKGAVGEDWPAKGEIQVSNLVMKYREDLKPALSDISFHINPAEKVGIAGRTGSGKSTMTVSLFRIIEAHQGSLAIDNVDISKIGLHDLRSRITIIPQDPVIFVGTVRDNLDPFERHSDDELWQSLELAHLKAFVADQPGQLDFKLSEGGGNISVGQRQLMCLARAILRKSKILVLDEATASVDLATDDLIQKTIRDQFAHSTVVTIAHRVNTIMDSDRILILEKGKIKEFGSPAELIASKGYFYSILKAENLLPRP